MRAARRYIVQMPRGEVPQFFVRVDGTHRSGLMKDAAKLIASRGASIASSQKIVLGQKFSLLMHVWVPGTAPKAEEFQKELSKAVGSGVSCVVDKLDAGSSDEYKLARCPLERRLTITCPQRPGLIFAVTDLLTAQGCNIPKLETKTYFAADETVFHLDALVQLPEAANADTVGKELELIMETNIDRGLKISWDDSGAHRINVLEGA
ncbi:hypothetical protein CTAYLR_002080 [Chrysophaeum taylorii]|uniref:ACT domain-containing protein n=1 Tax=Chrysophaeum taylorii TaxID=2483200 RepID=A0AAD7UMK4_9STRA|nr:hypothetical protein CTAYLR_002080 [Chrysophaeum taylorii]